MKFNMDLLTTVINRLYIEYNKSLRNPPKMILHFLMQFLLFQFAISKKVVFPDTCSL